jgi:DNA end-binding protein Ku
MAARAITSGTISFGLVSIPVKLYTAASSEQARFNLLHRKCGSRLKQQMICPNDGDVVERDEQVKGFEYARTQYVQFTDEELKALEAERSGSIEIVEFVPLSTVDFVHVEKSYYLGPDKGGDKAYKLLAAAMTERGRVAVGRWAARGKEQLVLIRPYKQGLILHQLFYANEVRAFDEIESGATFTFSEVEQDLAVKLIDQLTAEQFAADKFRDDYADRVQAAVEQKVAGQQITLAPEQPKAQIIDLFEALKKSLAAGEGRPAGGGEATPASPVKKALPRKAARSKTSAG